MREVGLSVPPKAVLPTREVRTERTYRVAEQKRRHVGSVDCENEATAVEQRGATHNNALRQQFSEPSSVVSEQ